LGRHHKTRFKAKKPSKTQDLNPAPAKEFSGYELQMMRSDILSFMFNWKGPLMGSLNLVQAISKIVSPEKQEELQELTEKLGQTFDTVMARAEELRDNYLDTEAEPIEEEVFDGLRKIKEDKFNTGVPKWARLKNLDNSEAMDDVWNQCKQTQNLTLETLRWARRLHQEECRKAGINPCDEIPQAALALEREEPPDYLVEYDMKN
jgi:hypothetical protein